jgi:cytoskeletal protein CcmA (bactofilin family)
LSRPLPVLGEGATWRGEVRFEGAARIDGTVVGNVFADDIVEIGPTGRIEGDLNAPQALIAGFVDGVVSVTERITLLETAIVRGRVITPWLDVRVGAQLEAELVVVRG